MSAMMSIKALVRTLIACAAVALFSSACQPAGTAYPPYPPPPTAARPSPTPAPATPTLIPPVSQEPAAGICAKAEGEWAVAEINADVPSPRCLKVTKQQRLKVTNRTNAVVQVRLGTFEMKLEPGATGTIEAPFGTFLAAGVHRVQTSPYSGPEVWLSSE